MSKAATTSTWSRAGLLLGVSFGALVFTNPALAQDAPPEGVPTSEDVVQDEQGQNVPEGATTETDATTIVVTGSRIRQPEFTSPDPVSLIDPQISQREGKADTASMLQSSPIAAGSTQITAAISSNFVTNGGPGAQTVDLRGLGPNRTLVLLNGRRAGPAGTRGAVSSFDLNVLPQSILSRVDVLKTGASSIYGSDAVAGVVNLITKTEFDGFQLDGNSLIPFDGGGEQYRISGMWGKKFDRGHITIAADYFKQNELSRGDRAYLACPEAYYFRADANNNPTRERADLIDPRTGEFKCEDLRWGHIWTYDLEYDYTSGNNPNDPTAWTGNLRLFDGRFAHDGGAGGVALMQYLYPGENIVNPPLIDPNAGVFSSFISPPGWFPTGFDLPSLAYQNGFHPYPLEQTIIPRTERKTFYADGAFELNDNMELFGEFLFNRRETYQNGWRQFWNFGLPGDFAGLGFGDPAAAGWEGYNFLSATGITNGGSDASQKVDYYRGVGGIRGDFGSSFLNGWSYDAYVQYSRSDGKYRAEQLLNDAVYELSYFATTLCADTTGPWGPVTPISGKQCLDLPWYDPYFMRGELTQEQRDYMFEWEEGRTLYTQLNGEASVSGSLFELPGGPLGVALGVTARRDKINDRAGHISLTENPFYDPTIPAGSAVCNNPAAAGRTLPCEQFISNAWGATSALPTIGRTDTTEAFGELSIPLLRDRPFFNLLSFSAAARVTNVKSVRGDGLSDKDNGNWTYKLGANWAPTNWLRFRGTYGTSFRAPALFEQFLGDEKSFVSQRSIDPCIRWAANLANGNISQRVADNCAADGIPNNHPGGGVSAVVVGVGGIGALDPETSKAMTASIILTPQLSFLPDTRISLAADYFDIEVKGEVVRLGAANIVRQCYASADFPDEPLCDLFQRGQVITAPNNISSVNDRFINIASQVNTGIDLTGNIRHNFGGWMGNLNILATMTWQLKDKQELFPGDIENLNGEIGSPKFVGDFNFTWQPKGGWSIFYGIDVIGGASSEVDAIEDQGSLCPTFIVRGQVCLDMKVPAVFYHAASVTKEIGDKFEITLGMSNIFDTRPPRITNVANNIVALIGPVVATSQYEFVGRRAFLNVTRRF